MNGKRFAWQAVVLLPWIDEDRLLKAVAPLLSQVRLCRLRVACAADYLLYSISTLVVAGYGASVVA